MQRKVKNWSSFLATQNNQIHFYHIYLCYSSSNVFYWKACGVLYLNVGLSCAIHSEYRHRLKENTEVFTLTIQTCDQHWLPLNGNFAFYRLTWGLKQTLTQLSHIRNMEMGIQTGSAICSWSPWWQPTQCFPLHSA